MKRRDFIKNSMLVSGIATLPMTLPLDALAKSAYTLATRLHDDSPICPVDQTDYNSIDFNGDDINRPHDLLWNIDGYLAKRGGIPKATEEHDLAIVGGGMSGLIAAHYANEKRVVVFESASRLGGNSKGEVFNKAKYSIGAAYICEPEQGSEIESMLKRLNVLETGRVESGKDTSVFYDKLVQHGFWSGTTDHSAKNQFEKIFSRLSELYEESDWDWEGDFAKSIDHLSFQEWLKAEFGDVHEHILEYFQLYGWSSFCGSISEISAFQYLGFISSETAKIMAFPGGNSAITQALTKNIRKKRGYDAIRSGAFVLKVRPQNDHIQIVYENQLGEIKTAIAKKTIMACPKFVANKLIEDLPGAQSKMMEKLKYRAYLVANLILKNKFQAPSYELFQLHGTMPPEETAMSHGKRSFTDICFGTWAQEHSTQTFQNEILSLYHGLPYDGARQFLFSAQSHDKYKTRYLKDIEPILNGMGLLLSDILGIRLTRWGHALPLAEPGLLASGTAKTASQPINNLIYFANQDNWMNPCFETAHEVALNAVVT